MTNRLLTWLFDLQSIRLGEDAPLMIEWSTHLPAWLLATLAIAALGSVFLIYRREQASTTRRLLLGALRCAVIALAITLLSGPVLILQRNQVEPAFVSIAIDNSMSMASTDMYTDQPLAAAITEGSHLESSGKLRETSRIDLVKAALRHDNSAALRNLAKHNAIHLAGFAGQVETWGVADSLESIKAMQETIDLIEPIGNTTDLAGAITGLIDNAQGRRIAALFLATDGQSTQPSGLREAIDLARGRQIPIYPIRIGSPTKPRDIEVGPLRAEDRLFVNDRLAIEARINTRGIDAPTPIVVQLFDDRSADPVDTRSITIDRTHDKQIVELYATPQQTGTRRYRVEVEPLPNEPVIENNVDYIDLDIVDDQLRVLYVEGYPRYEYRYLKNALLREPTIEVSILLVEADEQFVQEGTLPIRRFPQTPEELNRYDLVLFGDVDPRSGWLSRAQMNMLLDYVGNEGGGFGTIAGQRSAPNRFLGTPLEKLLPIRIDADFVDRPDAMLSTGYRPNLTLEGKRNRMFRLNPTASEHSEAGEIPAYMDPSSAPELYWIARSQGAKPGASVLMHHPDLQVSSDRSIGRGAMPIVVVGRYGAGKIFFQATDDTWRWRRHTGEFMHDTYWVQVTRELMRVDRATTDKRLSVLTDHRIYEYGAPVRVELHVEDTQLLSENSESIDVVANRDTTQRGATSPEGIHVTVFRLGPDSNRYEGRFVPPDPGQYTIRVEGVGPITGTKAPSATVRINRPDLETRRPEANHEVLLTLAQATGGSMVDLNELADRCAMIPDRSVQIPDDVTEPLWDSKVALALFALLITTEWIIRKASGLQ